MHIGEQGLQQVLLAGEMLVEGPGGPARGGRDVGDLGVQVAVLGELAPGCLLQRRLGLRGHGLAYSGGSHGYLPPPGRYRLEGLRAVTQRPGRPPGGDPAAYGRYSVDDRVVVPHTELLFTEIKFSET